MKFNKESKFAKVEAYGLGKYSGSEVLGGCYIPLNLYLENKDKIDNVELVIYELDGKYSETYCDMSVEILTLEEIIKYEGKYHKAQNVDESLYERVLDVIKDSDIIEYAFASFNNLSQLNDKIKELLKTSTKTITLTKDTVIEGVTISKGTLLEYAITNCNLDFEIKV